MASSCSAFALTLSLCGVSCFAHRAFTMSVDVSYLLLFADMLVSMCFINMLSSLSSSIALQLLVVAPKLEDCLIYRYGEFREPCNQVCLSAHEGCLGLVCSFVIMPSSTQSTCLRHDLIGVISSILLNAITVLDCSCLWLHSPQRADSCQTSL